MNRQESSAQIRAHHRAMVDELNTRVHAVGEAVCGGTSWAEPMNSVRAYLDEKVLPHAAAEENTLYKAAAKTIEAKLFVEAMIGEHRLLQSHIDRLREPRDGMDAYAQARVTAALFEAHAQKENEQLLAVLERDSGTRLETLVDGMHVHLAPKASAEEVPLDVREVPHAQRHTVIFGLFDRLESGQALVLTVDHDPLPLKYQLSALHPEGFSWIYRERGPAVWRVELRKT